MSEQQTPPGWYPDPMGRHEHRYWDGGGWTDQISDAGVGGVDPLHAEPPPAATEPFGGFPPADAPPAWGGATSSYSAPAGPAGGGPRRWPWILGGAVVLALLVAGAVVLLGGDDDDGDVAATETTTAADAGTSTTVASTSTTAASTTVASPTGSVLTLTDLTSQLAAASLGCTTPDTTSVPAESLFTFTEGAFVEPAGLDIEHPTPVEAAQCDEPSGGGLIAATFADEAATTEWVDWWILNRGERCVPLVQGGNWIVLALEVVGQPVLSDVATSAATTLGGTAAEDCAGQAPVSTTAPTTTAPAPTGYPQQVVDNFVNSCVGGGSTLTSCQCAITLIQQTYSLDQFTALEEEYVQTNVFPQELLDLIGGCFR